MLEVEVVEGPKRQDRISLDVSKQGDGNTGMPKKEEKDLEVVGIIPGEVFCHARHNCPRVRSSVCVDGWLYCDSCG